MSHSLPTLRIENEQCEAQILLQGAQLLLFAPRGQSPWIWNNPQTPFTPRKEIYGGVPIVFPWFNLLEGKSKDEAPNHGFARQAIWNLREQWDDLRHDGSYVNIVKLTLSSDDVRAQGLSSPLWDHRFEMEASFGFYRDLLQMCLSVRNDDDHAFSFECAFHPYFAVSDATQTRIERANQVWAFPDFGSVILEDVRGEFRVVSPDRTLRIYSVADSQGRDGWRSTVLWNPGQAMEDVRGDDWRRFVCVEPAAIKDNAVHLAPGETFSLWVWVEQEKSL